MQTLMTDETLSLIVRSLRDVCGSNVNSVNVIPQGSAKRESTLESAAVGQLKIFSIKLATD